MMAAVASSTEDPRNLSATPGAERGRLKPTDGAASPRRCAFLLPESVSTSGLGSEQAGGWGWVPALGEIADTQAQLGHAPKNISPPPQPPSLPPALWGIPWAAIAANNMASAASAGIFPSGRPAGVRAAVGLATGNGVPGSG